MLCNDDVIDANGIVAFCRRTRQCNFAVHPGPASPIC
jgi:hypothetical protein